MVGQESLLHLHSALCAVNCHEKPFGGVNIIAFGDFLQLSPVNQAPLYRNLCCAPVAAADIREDNIWSCFTRVTLLSRVEHSAGDPMFQEILEEARNRNVTQAK